MRTARKRILAIAAVIAALALIVFASAATIINALFSTYKGEIGIAGPVESNDYEQSTEIKVIAYNIAHCRGPFDFYGNSSGMNELDMDLTISSPRQVYKCLDNIAEMLVKEDADIALLQEVDKSAVWSYGIDFAPYIAEKAGMGYYAYGARYDFAWWPAFFKRADGGRMFYLYFNIGNAVISRYPILSGENKAFDRQTFTDWIAGEERYLDTVTNIRGKNARIISAHFGSGRIETKKIIEEAAASSLPLVFGGTLHLVAPAAKESVPKLSLQGADAMQKLNDSGLFSIYMLGVEPGDSSYYTSDTQNLYWTADYIIPTKDIEIKDYYVVDAELSDHRPVAAVLEVGA